MLVFKSLWNWLTISIHRLSWPILLATAVALFCATWAGLAAFEPPDSAIVKAENFWWYFIVTATTVGYGDMAPATLGGRATAAIINMMGGIALIGAILGKIASTIQTLLSRRLKGMKDFSSLSGHVVIVGWHDEDTLEMIDMILADPLEPNDIVLVSSLIDTNPLPDRIEFVHGKNIADQAILTRAGIRSASQILIHGQSDDQTLAVSISARALAPADCHIVAYVVSRDYQRLIQTHDPRIECVGPMTTSVLVRSLQDPWSSQVGREIYSSLEGQTQYSVPVPKSVGPLTALQVTEAFKRHHEALVIALGVPDGKDKFVVNPRGDQPVRPGDTIYYLAPKRLDPTTVVWS